MQLKHSLNYVLGSLSQAVVPIILFPILTKTSDKSSFGLLVTAISFSTILSYVFALGLPAIVSRQVIFDRNNSELLKNYLDARSKLILLILFLLNLIFIPLNLNVNIKNIFLIFSGAIYLSVVQIKLSIYRSEFKSTKFISLAIASTVIPLLVTTLLSNFNYKNLLVIYYFSSFSTIIAIIGVTKSNFKPKKIAIFPLIKSGYPMIAHGVSISIFQYGDKIAGYLGVDSNFSAEIAILSLILTAPMLLLNTLNNAWLPSTLEAFKKSQKNGYDYLNKTAHQIAIFISILIVIILVLIDPFLKLVVSNSYDSAAIQKSLFLGLFITPLYIIYLQNSHLITILKKFRILGIVTPISATLQFLFTFILVKNLGLMAVAIGLIVAISCQSVLTSIILKSSRQLNVYPVVYSLSLGLFSYLIYFFAF